MSPWSLHYITDVSIKSKKDNSLPYINIFKFKNGFDFNKYCQKLKGNNTNETSILNMDCIP